MLAAAAVAVAVAVAVAAAVRLLLLLPPLLLLPAAVASRKRPAPQKTHASTAGWKARAPPRCHASRTARPPGQVRQRRRSLSVAKVYRPGGHHTQCAAPRSAAYVPAAQGLHGRGFPKAAAPPPLSGEQHVSWKWPGAQRPAGLPLAEHACPSPAQGAPAAPARKITLSSSAFIVQAEWCFVRRSQLSNTFRERGGWLPVNGVKDQFGDSVVLLGTSTHSFRVRATTLGMNRETDGSVRRTDQIAVATLG